jgi:hypothetical protein
LRKAGIEQLSITQEFRDDPTENLIRQILGSFDEYQSRENGKHTLRAMQENAGILDRLARSIRLPGRSRRTAWNKGQEGARHRGGRGDRCSTDF